MVGISSHRKNQWIQPCFAPQGVKLNRSQEAALRLVLERPGVCGNRESPLGSGLVVGGSYILLDFFAKAKLGNRFQE